LSRANLTMWMVHDAADAVSTTVSDPIPLAAAR
jgi:hypothetical protein